MAHLIGHLEGPIVSYRVDGRTATIPVRVGAWWRALESADCPSFRVEHAGRRYTARRELRKGRAYWYAYQRQDGRLRKAYLGRLDELTAERLVEVAGLLSRPADGQSPAMPVRPTRSAGPQSPRSALVPRSALIPRGALALPPRPGSIIGRERDLALARQRLSRADVRLLTLTGPPGVGKTRLALELAADAQDELEDGARFVDLAPISDARLVPDATVRALGLRDVSRRAAADVLEEFLRDRSLLLVLDNFEQVLDAADLVGRLLAACPKLKVLATSRAPLHLSWERELPVPPLELPDLDGRPAAEALAASPAVRLFVERAQAVAPDFVLGDADAAAVAEICIHLDGLPLAIELAAARVKLFPPRALLRRITGADDGEQVRSAGQIRSPLRLLDGGSRDLPPRQRTLLGAIAWSYDLLDRDEQALFRRLAVFVGGCTLEAAEWVMGDGCWVLGDEDEGQSLPNTHNPSPIALDLVASLVDKSLVWREEQPDGEPRPRLLETLRELGLEQLRAGGELETTRRRHAEYYLELAEAAEPQLRGAEQAAWLGRLDRERDNFRAAIEWSIERGEAENKCASRIGLRLGGALWRFWWTHGQAIEGRAQLERLLSLDGAVTPTTARAKALIGAGGLARLLSDLQAAATLLDEGLAVARNVGDRGLAAEALHVLGWVAANRSDYARASMLYEESLATYRALGDELGIASLLDSLGVIARLERRYATARALFVESLAVGGRAVDRRGGAETLYNLGLTAILEDDLATARRRLEEALAVFRDLEDRPGIAVALDNLGVVALRRREHDLARSHCEESLTLARELGDRYRVSFVLESFAILATAQGLPERALRLVGAVAALRESINLAVTSAWRERVEADLAPARRALGETTAVATVAEGRAMSIDQAISYALTTEPIPRHGAGPQPVALLTRREYDVAALLARGLTNRQLAEALVVTEGTAENYVQRVLTKLDFHSRAQVAAWAVEHGLGPAPRP